MTIYKALSAMIALSLLLCACGGPPESVAQSERKRILAPDVPTDDIQILITGNNTFALELYQSLRAQDGNLFYSPFSISLALAMTYAGARAETEAQMADTLEFQLPQARLHPAFNALDQELAKRGESASKGAQPLQLDIVNAVWAQQDYPFQQEFLDLIASNYGAGIRLVDFVSQSEAIRKQINAWVSDQTRGKIEDLIPQGVLDVLTRMVLVNAIYFKADWQEQFDPDSTREAPFYRLDGSEVPVSMMSGEHTGLPYVDGDGYQAIALPYEGGTAAMEILLPNAGKFEAFEASLDAQTLDEIQSSMQPVSALLRLPKFTFTREFSLSKQLASMGMGDAFDPERADFSGMTDSRDLYISDVIHKAFVAVDEKGTEAAAATAVIMQTLSAPLFDLVITIDRPFIFVIRDIPSGQILFMGRVMNPIQ